MRRWQGSGFVTAVLLAAAGAALPACRGRDVGTSAQHEAGTPGAAADPSAERQPISLTGCMQRGAAGEYTLASVATGGVTEPGEAKDERSWTADKDSTPESRAQLSAVSSYRLVPAEEDQDFAEYVNTRVAVRGRLAADVPTGTSGTAARPQGTAGDQSGTGRAPGGEVERGATSSTVVGEAAPLRGFYVESIRKVADSCGQ